MFKEKKKYLPKKKKKYFDQYSAKLSTIFNKLTLIMWKGTLVFTSLLFFLLNFFHFPIKKLTDKIRRENVLLSLIMTL